MSKTKSTLAATFLTLVLAVPSLAGIIGTPTNSDPPPPPPPLIEGGANTTGLPQAQVPGNAEPSSQMLVDILLAVLSLF